MAAYVIANVEIINPGPYEDYKRAVPATIAAYGGRYLARGGMTETLDGSWRPRRVVILEFPSKERATAWWNSTEYAAPRALREANANSEIIVVEGI